jgi:hypothetical protein
MEKPGREDHPFAPGFLFQQQQKVTSMPKPLKASEIAPLFNWSLVHMHELALKNEIPLVVSESYRVFSNQDAFTYGDVLGIEVARQLHDDGGMPMADAAKLVWSAGVAVLWESLGEGVPNDLWIAVVRHRNTWTPSTPRGSFPVTLFGAVEYWSSAHFSGMLTDINRDIAVYVSATERDHPDSDPARIVLTNVSAADRRLRKRAAALGVRIAG